MVSGGSRGPAETLRRSARDAGMNLEAQLIDRLAHLQNRLYPPTSPLPCPLEETVASSRPVTPRPCREQRPGRDGDAYGAAEIRSLVQSGGPAPLGTSWT
jgi:hypothetical protein